MHFERLERGERLGKPSRFYFSVNLPGDIFDELTLAVAESGYSRNLIVCMALKAYLPKFRDYIARRYLVSHQEVPDAFTVEEPTLDEKEITGQI
jgi:hypothetical protein